MSKRSSLVGYIDHANDRILRGWAWDPSKPGERLELTVFWRGIFLGQTSAGAFRPDLQEAGIGDGRHGFVFHMPDDVPAGEIEPATFLVFPSGLPSVVFAAGNGSGRSSRLTPPRSARDFFGPYLNELRRAPVRPSAPVPARDRANLDVLLAPAATGQMSAYAHHIACKHGREISRGEDPQEFWRWYAETYCLERGPRRPPLSRVDLDHLRLSLGCAPHRDVASSDDATLQDRYEWAINESRRLHLEDCLVADRDAEALRAIVHRQQTLRFPLSNFMLILAQRQAVLRGLHARDENDRLGLYVLCILLALRSPHYLAYLPRFWLSQVLTSDETGSPFERMLVRMFGASYAISAAHCLRLLDIASGHTHPNTIPQIAKARVRVGSAQILAKDPPVDVQLIGPMRDKAGLGESCRRLAKALGKLSYSTNLVNYGLGGANREGACDFELSEARPARVNLLHLNLEEIPEALARFPDALEGSHLVAIPYWELDGMLPVHRLGLDIVDEVWVASHFLKGVFAAGPRPVTWTGLSHESSGLERFNRAAVRQHFGITADAFVFVTTFDSASWIQRKNPLGAIAAFMSAFTDENVALIIKTRSVVPSLSEPQTAVWSALITQVASDPRIKIVDAALSSSRHRALLAASDCLVGLHRAEGLGLDLLDAMGAGLPVVTTAYSGNLDFCSAETAWLVDYDLVSVGPDQYCFVAPGQRWAEPRVSSAADAMFGAFSEEKNRRRRAEAGRAFVEEVYSVDTFAARIAAALRGAVART